MKTLLSILLSIFVIVGEAIPTPLQELTAIQDFFFNAAEVSRKKRTPEKSKSVPKPKATPAPFVPPVDVPPTILPTTTSVSFEPPISVPPSKVDPVLDPIKTHSYALPYKSITTRSEDSTVAKQSTGWGPKTVYFIADPDLVKGTDAKKTLDQVRNDFLTKMKTPFPELNVVATPDPHLTLLTDNKIDKYANSWPLVKPEALKVLQPFKGDLYDVYLFVVYKENGQNENKSIVFVPDSQYSEKAIQTLINQGMDARPLADLATFVPNQNDPKKIQRSHLVVRVGTNGLVQGMAPSFNQLVKAKGLSKVEQYIDSPIGHITLATVQTGFFMSAANANQVIQCVQDARETLRGKDSSQKKTLEFKSMKITTVDPNLGGNNPRTLLAIEYN